MSPVKGLLQSRKFMLLVLDTVVGLTVFFVGKYANVASEDVGQAILYLQPVFVALIVSIAVEDAAAKRAGNFPEG